VESGWRGIGSYCVAIGSGPTASPHISRTCDESQSAVTCLWRLTALRDHQGFSSTDFSLCAFGLGLPLTQNPKQNRTD
jgi:hypothetical protein